MNRTANLIATAALAAAAATSTMIAPADAAASGGANWASHLRYHSVTWNDTEHPDDASYTIDAPRSWTLSQPDHSTGVFTSRTGTRTESLITLVGRHTVSGETNHRSADLEATRGVHVISRTIGKAHDGTRLGTLRYTQPGPDGTREYAIQRIVGYSIQGGPIQALFVVTVTGARSDQAGLTTLVDRVDLTAYSTP